MRFWFLVSGYRFLVGLSRVGATGSVVERCWPGLNGFDLGFGMYDVGLGSHLKYLNTLTLAACFFTFLLVSRRDRDLRQKSNKKRPRAIMTPNCPDQLCGSLVHSGELQRFPDAEPG